MLNNMKSNAAQVPCGKCGGYMGGKLLFLPGEVLQTGSRQKNPNAAVTTNCKKSAEAIVPEEKKKIQREGPNNRKSLVKTGRRSAW